MRPLALVMVVASPLALSLLTCADDERSRHMQRLEAENVTLRGPESYECKVLTAAQLGNGGTLTTLTGDLEAQTAGALFVVDRRTGQIAGGVGNNATFETRQVVFTPPDNPFYVVSFSHGPNRSVALLSIRDWVEGPFKPFVLVDSTFVFTGTCTR